MSKTLLAYVFGASLGLLTARAEACRPSTYTINEFQGPPVTVIDGRTVVVCPIDGYRFCPDGGEMLRQNVHTREAVVLNPTCAAEPPVSPMSGAGRERCYLDRCVPNGVYRYGYAVPFECGQSDCGAYYFTEVTVQNESSTICERLDGTSGPTQFLGEVPWGNDELRCGGTDDDPASNGCTVALGGRRDTGALAIILLGLVGLLGRARRTPRARI